MIRLENELTSIMTTSDIIQYRLFNQQIAETNFKKPAEIVGWLL